MGRIVIVDDSLEDLDSLRSLIQSQTDHQIVGEAGSVAIAKAMLKELQPGLLITDYLLPDGTGADLATEWVDRGSQAIIVTITISDYMTLRRDELCSSVPIIKKRMVNTIVATIQEMLALRFV